MRGDYLHQKLLEISIHTWVSTWCTRYLTDRAQQQQQQQQQQPSSSCAGLGSSAPVLSRAVPGRYRPLQLAEAARLLLIDVTAAAAAAAAAIVIES